MIHQTEPTGAVWELSVLEKVSNQVDAAEVKIRALESELVTGANPFLRREKMEPRPEDLARFDAAIAKAMARAQARLNKNPNDTRALYALGVAYGLRGNCGFLVRKAYMNALRDATSAR